MRLYVYTRKILSVLIVLTFLMQFFPTAIAVKAATDWTGYTAISSKADLDSIRYNLSGKYYLTADIYFTPEDFSEGGAFYNSGMGWNPIGTDSSNAFTGIFDGNGHTISGLNCIFSSAAANVNAGLFGYNKGTIQNLGMVNSSITLNSTSSSYGYVGGITGYNTGTILNVYNAGSVTGPLSSSNYSYTGGVAGYSTGTITDCSNSGRVAGPASYYTYTGGIAGYNYGSLNDSGNTGSVSGCNVGGVAGYNNYKTISNCYNTGKIDGIGWLGGIAGYNRSGTISRCYNTSRINSPYSDVGGIVGYASSGDINNCYNTGNLCGKYAGGIAGYSGANISNCYSIGSVYGDTVGGIVGTNYLGTLVNCYFLNINSGDGSSASLTLEEMKSASSYSAIDFTDIWAIDSSAAYKFPTLKNLPHVEMEEDTIAFSGGNGSVYNPYEIADKNQLDNVRNDLAASYILTADIVFNEADFEQGGAFYNGGDGWKPLGTDYSNPFGGIFDGKGYTISGLVSNVTSSSYNAYAGLFGYNSGVIKNTGITGSSIRGYFNGSARSAFTAYAGGITGQNYGSIISCYNTGSVNSESLGTFAYSGGITGLNFGNINNCYNTGSVGGARSAGIAGKNSRNISNCYNTGAVSGCGIAADNDYGSISNCYNSGNAGVGIIADSGLYGYTYNCYYLNSTSYGHSDCGTPLTIDQMKDQASFSGFDFENIWTMDNNASYKLPTLKGMAAVNNREMISISISQLPDKTAYILGQNLDLTGMQILVAYNDGSVENINVTPDMVYGYVYNQIGEQTITVFYGSRTTTFMITVKSNEKPVISGAADRTIKVGDSFDVKAGVTAADAEDGDLTSGILVSGSVDITKPGNYTVTYTVIDSYGDMATKSITISVAARNVKVVSLIGSNRYDTAAKLSQSQFSTANTVIIVNGGAMADGLGATPLAKYENAPLLLTGVKSLPDETINEIKRLNAKNAIIVGGSGVVSDDVKSQLQALGLSVDRICGSNRYGTSLAVAEYIDKNCYDVSRIVISNGYGEADALSIASAAGRDNMPIILVEKDSIPAEVYDWLASESIENAYIIGGTGVVSDNVLNKIDGITAADVINNRLGGQNRFETNSLVIDRFYGSVINKTYIAKGYVLIDALAAGPVAAINGAPVVLSDKDLTTIQKTILNKRYGDTIIRTGGGISDTAVNSIVNCLR